VIAALLEFCTDAEARLAFEDIGEPILLPAIVFALRSKTVIFMRQAISTPTA
jgi:hypothetical protein